MKELKDGKVIRPKDLRSYGLDENDFYYDVYYVDLTYENDIEIYKSSEWMYIYQNENDKKITLYKIEGKDFSEMESIIKNHIRNLKIDSLL